MTGPAPEWPTCERPDCDGIRLEPHTLCLAHLDPGTREAFLTTLEPGGKVDFRGTTFSADLLRSLLEALTRSIGEERWYEFGDASFDGARFTHYAGFHRARFRGDAWFPDAIFAGAAGFREARFANQATFAGARFHGETSFNDASFGGGAAFNLARFDAMTYFTGAHFHGYASFASARFGGGGQVPRSWARFDDVQFHSSAAFNGAQFDGHATFTTTRFSNFSTDALSATRFSSGVSMRLSAGRVGARQATFGAPSTIAGVPGHRVALVSLEGADCTNLTVASMDLTMLKLTGAHHLDELRVEGDCTYPRPPTGLHAGMSWPPVWWWTQRRTLAEEGDWRMQTRKRQDWVSAGSESNVTPAVLAGLYRQHRKAEEDAKNQPGANDFYYGEMEMRLHSRRSGWPERAVLFLYWLVSGYGLRASRALGCLFALVLLAAAGLMVWGFTAPVSFPQALLYATSGTVSLQPALPRLTGTGEVLRIALRIGGPLFIGLALLAVRNRVKR